MHNDSNSNELDTGNNSLRHFVVRTVIIAAAAIFVVLVLSGAYVLVNNIVVKNKISVTQEYEDRQKYLGKITELKQHADAIKYYSFRIFEREQSLGDCITSESIEPNKLVYLYKDFEKYYYDYEDLYDEFEEEYSLTYEFFNEKYKSDNDKVIEYYLLVQNLHNIYREIYYNRENQNKCSVSQYIENSSKNHSKILIAVKKCDSWYTSYTKSK